MTEQERLECLARNLDAAASALRHAGDMLRGAAFALVELDGERFDRLHRPAEERYAEEEEATDATQGAGGATTGAVGAESPHPFT